MKCSQCGKGPVSANRIHISRSHVSRRSKRRQKPNVSKRRINIGGVIQTLCICTKCVRTIAKQLRG